MDLNITFPNPYLRITRIAGYVGLFAALLVGVGEFLVHYSAGGYQSDIPYQLYEFVSPGRLNFGHFLIIAGLPLYIVGYFHLYLALRLGSQKLAVVFLCIGIISFIVGGVWVGSRGFLGHIYHTLSGPEHAVVYLELVTHYKFLIESLVQILRVFVLFNSLLFVYIILKYETLYPKWMVIFNPVLWLAVVFLLFFTVPIVGNFLAPTAMNAAHVVVFIASLCALSKSKIK